MSAAAVPAGLAGRRSPCLNANVPRATTAAIVVISLRNLRNILCTPPLRFVRAGPARRHHDETDGGGDQPCRAARTAHAGVERVRTRFHYRRTLPSRRAARSRR